MRKLPLMVVLAVGCASSPAPPPQVPPASQQAPPAAATASPVAAPPACPRAAAFDAASVTDEVVCLLQRYVQIDTTNPPGSELAAARFLAEVLHRDGIEAQIIESAPGRANLVARLPGAERADGGAIALMHHMDVVPATESEWSVPPLSATLRDGHVWGRGSLDNKGAGVVQLVAMLMLKRLGVVPPRDVVLLAVADEEAGGGVGARFVVEQHPELLQGVGYVLNEGGAIVDMGEGRAVFSVELAQKAPLWLRVTAEGPSGHGASPSPEAATHVLTRALGRALAHEFPIKVLPEVQAAFANRARGMPHARRERFTSLARSLKDPAFAREFLADPRQAALVRNTLSITQLAGSDKENVLAPRATAVLDLRLLPGEDPAAVIDTLTKVMAEPALKIEPLLSWKAHASPRETPLFAAIEALAAQRHAGVPVTTSVIGGFTDCNALRARGIVCYGFIPMRLQGSELSRIHGKDERVSVAALAAAVVDLAWLLQHVPASAP